MHADYTDQGIDSESGLTLKQRLFCDYYLTHLNARKAFQEAGYSASTAEIARIEATKLLNIPSVSEWLKGKMNERVERLAVRADAVLKELVMIASASITDYRINPATGLVEVVPGVPQECLKAVKSVKSSSRTRTTSRGTGAIKTIETETIWSGEIVLHDKLKACQMICDHLGLLSAELPPLEVLLNRLPPKIANALREILRKPAGYERPERPKPQQPQSIPEP